MKNKTLLTMLKLFSFAMMLVSCISFEDANLDEKAALAPPAKTSSSKSLDLNANYSCVKDWPYLSLSGSALQVALKDAKGNCFGIYFDTKDISANPIIKVRAKYLTSSKVASVDLLAGFTDDKGGKNYSPEKSKIVKTGTDYLDFYFDYSQEIKAKDSYINPTKVKSILIFVNILGVDNVAGTLTIEEISLSAKI